LPDLVTLTVQSQNRTGTELYLEFDLARLDRLAASSAVRAAPASRPDLSCLFARQLARFDHLADPTADVLRVHEPGFKLITKPIGVTLSTDDITRRSVPPGRRFFAART